MRRWLIAAVLSLRMLAQPADSETRVEALYAEAKAAQAHGDITAAVSKYEEILRIAPKLGPAYNNLGALYFRERDYRKAAATLEKGLTVDPSMASAKALLGISLYEAGEYAKARPYLEAAQRSNSADTNARIYLAKDLTKLGDYNAAAAQLKKFGEQNPKNQEAWYLLAKVYMKLSEQAFSRMNSIDPNSVLAHELSAELMESMNNYDGAVVELKKAVEMAPNRPGTHYKLGEAYFSLSQWNLAGEQYRAELGVDSGSCLAQWKIGAVMLQQNGDAGEALAAVDKSLTMCPGMTEARVDRGRALLKLDRPKEAVTDLEAAAKANPNDAPTHFLLARAYRSAGNPAQAQAEMQIFSKLDEAARAAIAHRAEEVIENKQAAH